MGEEGIYCCAINQFHQDSFRAAASRRVGLDIGRSQGIVSECHTRPPAYQTPRRAGPPALHRGRIDRYSGRIRSVHAGARLHLRAGEYPCRNQLT